MKRKPVAEKTRFALRGTKPNSLNRVKISRGGVRK